MKKVGFIGWRGMVGSVLMERMLQENDFSAIKSYFFSTSLGGEKAPALTGSYPEVLNSKDISQLKEMDILVSCQGGDYTKEIFPLLRSSGWNGYWIDAASSLRMDEDAIIILDPVNRDKIEQALNNGVKNFIGGNCTVSLMLIGLHGLFKEGLVDWVSSMTYQAASGAGAKNMIELLSQMKFVGDYLAKNPTLGALEIEKKISQSINESDFPKENFGHPLALNLLPWIDTELTSGQSKEEWKAQVEANKILQSKKIIPVDGTCVRVGALRCHSQALTIKLNRSVELPTIEQLIQEANPWVRLIPNNKAESLKELTPVGVSGKLTIPVGRLRKMTLGDDFLNAFTCGDQLLWGAAEPLRCMLKLLT